LKVSLETTSIDAMTPSPLLPRHRMYCLFDFKTFLFLDILQKTYYI
jgi:hypothetical protein